MRTAGRRHGCVEKLADYSIVGPVVSVNRHASWRFVVLLSHRSADQLPAAPTRIHEGVHPGIQGNEDARRREIL